MKREKQRCNYVAIALNKKLQGNLNECSYYAETDTNQNHAYIRSKYAQQLKIIT